MPVMDDEPERERPDGAEELGLWCNRCMLPSAGRWLVMAFAGTRPVGKVSAVVCVDCGGRLDPQGNVVG